MSSNTPFLQKYFLWPFNESFLILYIPKFVAFLAMPLAAKYPSGLRHDLRRMLFGVAQGLISSSDRKIFVVKIADLGPVVSVLVFYTDDPSSNPTEAPTSNFSWKELFQKNENNPKEVGPFFLKKWIERNSFKR